MHWILQSNCFAEEGWNRLVRALEVRDVSYSVHKAIPFIGELDPEPTIRDNVIVMGAYGMRNISKKYGLTPGVFDLYDFDFNVQREHWGDRMLNYDCEVLPFGQVEIDEPKFIRPIHDSKTFAGGIFNPKDFYEWKEKCKEGFTNGSSLTFDTLVQVNKIIKIFAEYRFWVVNQKIVTGSQYKMGNRVIGNMTQPFPIPTRINWFASGLVDRDSGYSWNPVDAFVVDVCESEIGNKVVEINTFNASGFYNADMDKVVEEIEKRFG